jgi:tetratricopeptide (TPR) repeat protein
MSAAQPTMTKLKLSSLLLAIAVGFVVGAYGIAYVVASETNAGSESESLVSVDANARADFPDAATQIAFWSRRVAAQPRGYLDLTLLGQAFARRARETSDVDFYVRAENALRRALWINPKYVQAKASLAGVQLSLHEFGKALATARPISDHPGGVQALATLGDAYLALGDYAQAQSAYTRLLAWAATPAAYSRLASLAVLRGNATQAIRLLEQAARLAQKSGDYGESLGWYSYQLGEVSFRIGRLDAAETHYRDALQAFPDYPLALGGLAKTRAARGDLRAAIELYRRATEIVPQPDLLAALGDVYRASGDGASARTQYATVQVIAKLVNAKRQVYNRQLAIFYADHGLHLDTSRRLALRELRARKDVYGYDAASWALARSGECAKALPLARRALRLGTLDPLLYFHRGYAEGCAGNRSAMLSWYRSALELNPNFSLRWAPVARHAVAAERGSGGPA